MPAFDVIAMLFLGQMITATRLCICRHAHFAPRAFVTSFSLTALAIRAPMPDYRFSFYVIFDTYRLSGAWLAAAYQARVLMTGFDAAQISPPSHCRFSPAEYRAEAETRSLCWVYFGDFYITPAAYRWRQPS